MNKNIIGIDLGTTMSGIARLNPMGKPEIIATSGGERIMPSVIFFSENNEIIIGTVAKNTAKDDPTKVAREFKREMNNPDFKFKVDNDSYTATELSAFILKKLIDDASSLKHIGEIKKVVISVPAYFGEKERNATIEAGKLAKLDVIGIINEPTAAALYYATTNDVNGNFLIYDLGGGTFDVTAVNIKGKNIKVLAAIGEHRLGGVDFDNIILGILEEKFEKEIGKKLYNDKEGKEEFLLLSEDIKKNLSMKQKVKVKLRSDNGSATVIITQKEFNEKMENFIIKTELAVKQVIKESKLGINDFKNVLLVGGSTRIPAIRESIKRIMGKEPINHVNVDEAVALGAALKAGLRENISELSDVKMQDVANHSYGTIFFEGYSDNKYNEIIIEKNSSLPCYKTTYSRTRYDNQEDILYEITQGEGSDPESVEIIDDITLKLPKDRPKGQPGKVTFSYDENQIMYCEIEDINSGLKANKHINMEKIDNKK